MSKKLIIFDLDGTLLDTSPDLMASMNKMLDRFGFPHITIEQTKEYIGDGARNFVLRSLPADKKQLADEALAVYNELYTSCGSPLTALYDGMGEVLRALKREGALMAIASNKPQAATDEVYAKYLSAFGFDYVYGNRSGFAHKPEKECGDLILSALGIKPCDSIVVGDGDTDVKFAKALGSPCVAVTWGYRSREKLASVGAEIFADSPAHLIEILKKYISEGK